jgi:MFS transporter, DHA2 family, methylenomycin A resistance protein
MVIKQSKSIETVSVLYLSLIAPLLVFVQSTDMNVLAGPLTVAFNATRAQLEWSVNAYTLTLAAGLLGAGGLVDSWGPSRAFRLGTGLFALTSIAAALAPNIEVLIAALLVMGLGAALLMPSSLVLITAGFTGRKHTVRVGWWAAAGSVGMSAGPLLSGLFTQFSTWRSVFWCNAVICALALAWSWLAIPHTASQRRHIDIPGLLSAAIAIAGLVYALIEASQGMSPDVYAALAVAAIGLAAFVAIERRSATPALPLAVFSDRVYRTTLLQGALFNFSFFGLMFAMGLMLQQGRGMTAFTSSLLFLPLTAAVMVSNLSVAWLSSRFGTIRVLAVAQAVFTVSLLALGWFGVAGILPGMIASLIPAGLAAGILVPTMTGQSLSTMPPELHGVASSGFNTARQLGSAIGVAVFGLLLSTDLITGFGRCLIAAATAAALTLALTPALRRTRA